MELPLADPAIPRALPAHCHCLIMCLASMIGCTFSCSSLSVLVVGSHQSMSCFVLDVRAPFATFKTTVCDLPKQHKVGSFLIPVPTSRNAMQRFRIRTLGFCLSSYSTWNETGSPSLNSSLAKKFGIEKTVGYVEALESK